MQCTAATLQDPGCRKLREYCAVCTVQAVHCRMLYLCKRLRVQGALYISCAGGSAQVQCRRGLYEGALHEVQCRRLCARGPVLCRRYNITAGGCVQCRRLCVKCRRGLSDSGCTCNCSLQILATGSVWQAKYLIFFFLFWRAIFVLFVKQNPFFLLASEILFFWHAICFFFLSS